MRTVVILLTCGLTIFGQRHRIEEVDAEKPEGKLLQQALQENDPAKKAALMEQFAEQFPKLDATAAILEQLQALYVKAGQPDKILSAGDRLLALDPEHTEAALQCLKAAEAKKDLPLIKKYSAVASANARKLAATPKPADAEEAKSWASEVDYAKQVDTYTEYALYAAAVEARDPKEVIALGEMLEARNPASEYTAKARQPLFAAYRQSGANDKALALAEKVLATDQSNEDMLLVAANHYLEAKTEPEKVHAYSAKIVEIMSARPKPEGVSDADWSARKNLVIGVAHFMNGKLYYSEKRYPQADRELREALPRLDAGGPLKPEALFYLGFANYSQEKIQEAYNYYKACAALKSPFQALAAKNMEGIRAKYTGVR